LRCIRREYRQEWGKGEGFYGKCIGESGRFGGCHSEECGVYGVYQPDEKASERAGFVCAAE
jgi:hypothetical protein